MANRPATYLVGCDIGGTFTDLVALDERSGEVSISKVRTTPADPSEAVISGVGTLAASLPNYIPATRSFRHGTTLVGNAVVERRGAKTALLTTEGFRDVLEVRRHARVKNTDMWSDPPEPLVPRHLRIPIRERSYSDGRILTPVDPEQVRAVFGELRRDGIESVAVSFLHAYASAANEDAVGAILRELDPGLPVTLSSQVLPEYMEFERTATTVVNAYVKPITRRYLPLLQDRLAGEGLRTGVFVSLSNGGLAAVDTATEFPVRLIESGPVAGVVAARMYARTAGLDEVLSLDMGGTTAKACLITDGVLPLSSELEVARTERFEKGSGYPVSIPSVDLIEVGAGGGSIAHINPLGLLQVGPESAGADPGPICYGSGGEVPTVTDADLVLGYLNPDYFLGGEMTLHAGGARQGLEARLGAPSGATRWRPRGRSMTSSTKTWPPRSRCM